MWQQKRINWKGNRLIYFMVTNRTTAQRVHPGCNNVPVGCSQLVGNGNGTGVYNKFVRVFTMMENCVTLPICDFVEQSNRRDGLKAFSTRALRLS
jgi:hypothetical protein